MLCKKAHSPTQGLEFGVSGERREGGSVNCPGYSLKDQIQAAQTDPGSLRRPCSMGRAGKEVRRQADERNAMRLYESTLQKVCTGCGLSTRWNTAQRWKGTKYWHATTQGMPETSHRLKEARHKRLHVTRSISPSAQSRRTCGDREQTGGFLGLGMGTG